MEVIRGDDKITPTNFILFFHFCMFNLSTLHCSWLAFCPANGQYVFTHFVFFMVGI